ncbi:hypothetical protein ACN47E_006939 [Coniothyrium glycines]
MASRSFGEIVLRPSSFTRIPHTTRPHSIRWLSQTPSRRAQPPHRDDEDPFSIRPAPRNSNRRSSSPSQSETSQAIDSLFRDLPRNNSRGPTPPSSSDELRAAHTNHVFGAQFSPPGRGHAARGKRRLNFDDMVDFPGDDSPSSLMNKPSAAASLAAQQESTFVNYPRLNPAYGRTVDLDPGRGRDLVRGMFMLSGLMSRNKVKADFNKQRFHERPGLKRKRLKSERWRARFKVAFRQVTERVTELRKKGW